MYYRPPELNLLIFSYSCLLLYSAAESDEETWASDEISADESLAISLGSVSTPDNTQKQVSKKRIVTATELTITFS